MWSDSTYIILCLSRLVSPQLLAVSFSDLQTCRFWPPLLYLRVFPDHIFHFLALFPMITCGYLWLPVDNFIVFSYFGVVFDHILCFTPTLFASPTPRLMYSSYSLSVFYIHFTCLFRPQKHFSILLFFLP